MEQMSKKHHYLPRYYLTGFTNSDNSFFVYDKQKDIIFPSSPDNSFFINNLNTATLPDGSSSDFLEGLYTDLENLCWPSLDAIRKSTSKNPVQLLDMMHLFLFILYLYWRLPSNIEIADRLSEKAFIDNNDFDYFRLMKSNGEKAPKEIAESMKKSQAFKKAFRQVVPLLPFFKDKNWAFKLNNWRFFYSETSWDMVGDNPIIVRDINNHDLIYCLEEFVFPVSGKILLVNINKPPTKGLPPKFTIQFNTALIEKSQRFVACQNKDFLEAQIRDFKLHIRFNKTNIIIPELFDMLEK